MITRNRRTIVAVFAVFAVLSVGAVALALGAEMVPNEVLVRAQIIDIG